MPSKPEREIVLLHSSDLHIDDPIFLGSHSGLDGLESVLATAASHDADAVLLAGDTFDNGRVPAGVLQQARALMAAAGRPVVLLPGNHDPLQQPCLFQRAALHDLPHVHVLGVTCAAFVRADLGLEVYGLPHRDFADFPPVPMARPRTLRWQVLIAHGHYVPPGQEEEHAHRAWRFDDAALVSSDADYIALGHWDRPLRVGTEAVLAYYSGSPDLARTANLVRLHSQDGVAVSRVKLAGLG
jgi:DNA repair exonuclease SbcCD nuclease subunit